MKKKNRKTITQMFQVEDQFYSKYNEDSAKRYAALRNETAKPVWVVTDAAYKVEMVQRDRMFAEYLLDSVEEAEYFAQYLMNAAERKEKFAEYLKDKAEETNNIGEVLFNSKNLEELIRDRHYQYLLNLEEKKRLLGWDWQVVCVKFGEYLSVQMNLKVCMLSEKELWAVGYYNDCMNKIKMRQRVYRPIDILNEIEDEYRAYLLAKAQ
ncbi:hypothetical protein CN918_29590 [Priestia megaterium]|nr:hypothetical protein CN918_29590 [Priestia megaterium]